jgi:hypothetical protein
LRKWTVTFFFQNSLFKKVRVEKKKRRGSLKFSLSLSASEFAHAAASIWDTSSFPYSLSSQIEDNTKPGPRNIKKAAIAS